MQDPLYRAAARSVVHWLAAQAGLVCKNGRLHPSVALTRPAAYSMCGLGLLHASPSCHPTYPCLPVPRLVSCAPSR
jgi:hypothetical protein